MECYIFSGNGNEARAMVHHNEESDRNKTFLNTENFGFLDNCDSSVPCSKYGKMMISFMYRESILQIFNYIFVFQVQ